MVEGRSTDIVLYPLLHKVETGLGQDTLPVKRGECTPADIKRSVVEAGKVLPEPCNNEGEKPTTSVMW
jgi:hypothetical protein